MKQENERYVAKQKRSEVTRNKIMDAALKLFCQSGYYKVSTNEIAAEANISIGNLYFHFPNKEEIFMQILNRYFMSFMQIHEDFLKEIEELEGEPKIFLKELLDALIKNHENSLELNREIRILCFSNSKVLNVVEEHQIQFKKTAINYFQKYKDKLKIQDIEGAAEVTFLLIDSVVDQIAFSKNNVNKERLLTETLSALEAYLLI